MKKTLIIGENLSEEKFPNAVIISKEDAFKIFNLKNGEEISLNGKYTNKAKLIDDNYIFYGLGFNEAILPKKTVHQIINKFYYIGQKLSADSSKKR